MDKKSVTDIHGLMKQSSASGPPLDIIMHTRCMTNIPGIEKVFLFTNQHKLCNGANSTKRQQPFKNKRGTLPLGNISNTLISLLNPLQISPSHKKLITKLDSSMEGTSSSTSSELPPGFRFHPTDEELIVYYLCNQATSKPCPASIIPEVDIYKFDPWELPDKAVFGEKEWYFFTPRDRKYPNGVRPNRATVSGYWKATGTDKAIFSKSKNIGVKKALVFYTGKPPKGIKTDWIMHEYRLIESNRQTNKPIGSMRLDDWVLCRIYKKKHTAKALDLEQTEEYPTVEINLTAGSSDCGENEMMKLPRTSSLTYLMDMNYFGPISQLLNDEPYNSAFDFQNSSDNIGIDPFVKPELIEMTNHYAEDSGCQIMKQGSTMNQRIFVKQLHD